jgi:hypothetical protein
MDICLKFGKYRGRSLEYLYANDRQYLDWMVSDDYTDLRWKAIVRNFLIDKINGNVEYIPSITARKTDIKQYGIDITQYVNLDETIIINACIKWISIGQTVIRNTIDSLKKISNTTNVNQIFFNISNIHLGLIDYNAEDLYKCADKNVLHKITLFWHYGIRNNDFKDELNKDPIKDLFVTVTDKIRVNRLKRGILLDSKITESEFSNILRSVVTDPGGPYEIKQQNHPFYLTKYRTQLLLLDLNDRQMKSLLKCDKIFQSLEYPRNDDVEICYYKFLLNPYTFYNVPLDKCDKVITISGRDLRDFKFERSLGSVSHFIKKTVKDDLWTACPQSELCGFAWLNDVELKKVLVKDYGLVIVGDKYYLHENYVKEELVARILGRNANLIARTTDIDLDQYDVSPLLTEEQRNAIISALTYGISFITGLAGTGKSKMITSLVQCLNADNKTYQICCPTGKASGRVKKEFKVPPTMDVYDVFSGTQTIDCIRTIHSLIYGLGDTIPYPNFIIVDEASMVSIPLMYELLKRFEHQTTNFVFIGDYNQLPPMEYGRPFEELVLSGLMKCNQLTKNLRTVNGNDDPIIVNANNIVRLKGYRHQEADNFTVIPETVGFVQNLIQTHGITLDNFGDHKFITPTNASMYTLNKELAFRLNPNNYSINIQVQYKKGENLLTEQLRFSVGDPIICLKNDNYKLYPDRMAEIKIYNGTEGVIKSFNIGDGVAEIVMTFGAIDIVVPLDNVDKNIYEVQNFMLSYCITVHKAQGSEWGSVYYYVNSKPTQKFGNKRMAYTSVTRARKMCTVIESSPGLFDLSANTLISPHYGGLVDQVRQYIHK